MVGHNGTVGCHIVFSILDAVQFEHRYTIEIHHVADDVVGRLFLLEKEATGRYPVFQRNGRRK